MAKGDAGGPNSPQGAAPPKMDQYSVMHGIMERLGQAGATGAGSIAPSPNVLGNNSSFNPGNPPPYIGAGQPGTGVIPNYGGGSGRSLPHFGGGGQMGSPFGQYSHDFTPMGLGSMSIAPQQMMSGAANIGPQQTFRRQMMGNNVS